MKRKINMTWEEFDDGIDNLVTEVINQKLNFNGVYGIPRGGLVVAVTLSHRLNIPLLKKPIPGCLIVDDISDNGNTLLEFKDDFIITLFSTAWTKTKPNIFIYHKMSQHDWIVFPWECVKPHTTLFDKVKGG